MSRRELDQVEIEFLRSRLRKGLTNGTLVERVGLADRALLFAYLETRGPLQARVTEQQADRVSHLVFVWGDAEHWVANVPEEEHVQT